MVVEHKVTLPFFGVYIAHLQHKMTPGNGKMTSSYKVVSS